MGWCSLDERTEERLLDILEFADELAAAIAGMDYARFKKDRLKRRVAERLLEIAGEAATYVPDEAVVGPLASWVGIRKMRIVLAHAYGSVDDRLLWEAASISLPALASTIRAAYPDLE
jgi:uncharacterized protein with HEPN domain